MVIEYKCPLCNTIFEEYYKKYEDVLQYLKCPECGTESQKIISKTSKPKFNGNGFYSTDYPNKNNESD